MKIIFVNRFFYPDGSATSQIASDLAFHLSTRGHNVHVVTAQSDGDFSKHEKIQGVEIHRICAPTEPGLGLTRRVAAYVCFYSAARRTLSRILSGGDIVIAKTDPPMLATALDGLAAKANARLVVWLQDLFPEVAEQYGIPLTGGAPGAALRRLRDSTLKSAAGVVAIGDRMAALLASRPLANRTRMHVIHNWADERAILPIAPSASSLRQEWGLQEKFVVAYSGNLGRVHEFDTLADAAELLREHPRIVVLIIGRGPRLNELRRAAASRQLSNVVFQPPQERACLCESLGVADLHLCILRPEFEGLVVPSKLYGIMAAGKPTVFIGAEDSECGGILRRHEAGVTVRTGDGEGLSLAIQALAYDEERRTVMGRNARKAFEKNYSMSIALRKWEQLLERL